MKTTIKKIQPVTKTTLKAGEIEALAYIAVRCACKCDACEKPLDYGDAMVQIDADGAIYDGETLCAECAAKLPEYGVCDECDGGTVECHNGRDAWGADASRFWREDCPVCKGEGRIYWLKPGRDHAEALAIYLFKS